MFFLGNEKSLGGCKVETKVDGCTPDQAVSVACRYHIYFQYQAVSLKLKPPHPLK